MPQPVYLDNHATTAVDPRVRDAVLPWLTERFGNAGSKAHAYGWQARDAVERAREQVARMLGSRTDEVAFTSGATEADNLAILGVARRAARPGRIVTTAVEHHAVLDTCRALAREGVTTEILPVDGGGRVDAGAVAAAAAHDDTLLVSVMAANNEVGTIQPLEAIGGECKRRGVLFHCDAAQAVGRIPIDVEAWGVDLLALSGHKFHAPQGVGALYVRRRAPRVQLAPVLFGGGQEMGLRPGTLNVPGIVGLGAAAQCVTDDLATDSARIGALRDALQERLVGCGGRVNGDPAHRLPGNLSIRFEGVDSEELMLAAPQIAFSAGAACASGDKTPSAVLLALGLTPEQARATVRFGLSRFTTAEEVERASEVIAAALARLRRAAGRA